MASDPNAGAASTSTSKEKCHSHWEKKNSTVAGLVICFMHQFNQLKPSVLRIVLCIISSPSTTASELLPLLQGRRPVGNHWVMP